MCVQSDNRAFASAADDDDDDDDEPAPAPARPLPVQAAAAGAGRGSGRGGAASSKGHKDAASRQAEFRAKKLAEEAEVSVHNLQAVEAVQADACMLGGCSVAVVAIQQLHSLRENAATVGPGLPGSVMLTSAG